MTRLDQLDAIEATIWSELIQAARESSHPWRVGMLATTDGASGDGRCIVLRDADAASRSLVFYCDSRSPKVAQFERFPGGTIVLWSPARGWQVRLRVRLSIETSGLTVSSRWAILKMTPGAYDYLSPLPPGTPVATPRPERGSREFFGVVTAAVEAIDWTELSAKGHRRAAFDVEGRRWLVP